MTRKTTPPMDIQEETLRILAMQLRLQYENQNTAIVEMSKAGFAPARIAELLGANPNTVKTVILRAREKARKTKKKAAGG